MTELNGQEPLYLGIDTGGTYTDAVMITASDSKVLCADKALTTRHDLTIGLRQAIEKVVSTLSSPYDTSSIRMVSVSTTLATNALVEGDGSPVCALFIGYEQNMIDKSSIRQKLSNASIATISGGHDGTGQETNELDESAIEQAVKQYSDQVDAFAISSTFGVRNPAHEICAREIISNLCDKPVTCGHELTSALDAPRRALTTALNASLIPRIRSLIDAVKHCMDDFSIKAPLMMVKGDGTVVTADVIQTRPIETILSGPAASMIGAKALCNHDSFIMSDMGGTTTDLGVLRDGRVKLNAHGAEVGGTRTMIQAIDLHTFALGGDSLVDIGQENQIDLGPRRAIPISLLGQREDVQKQLRSQLTSKDYTPFSGWFAVAQGEVDELITPATHSRKLEILELLRDGPCPLDRIIVTPSQKRHLDELCRQGMVALSGFTPSDAMHVIGTHKSWSREAAKLGAALLLRWRLGVSGADDERIKQFCHEVKQAVENSASLALLKLSLHADDVSDDSVVVDHHEGIDPLLKTLSEGQHKIGLATVNVALDIPIVAVGAPAEAYYPQVGKHLNCEVLTPKHYAVANAVGAVSGLVIQSSEILISRPDGGAYRVHRVDQPQEFNSWLQALEHAKQSATDLALEQALKAGAASPRLVTSVEKLHLPGTSGDEGVIEATVKVEAIGRPSPALS